MKITDRLVELLALKRVAYRGIEGRLADSKAERTDTDPTTGQLSNRYPETIIELSHKGYSGDTAILEQQFVSCRSMLAHLLFSTTDNAAGGPCFNQKTAYSPALWKATVGNCPDDKNSSVGCAGNKNFTAVKDPVITVLVSKGRHRRGVRTSTGFG